MSEVDALKRQIHALCLENQLARARLDKLEVYRESLEKLLGADVCDTARQLDQLRRIRDLVQSITLEENV